MSIFIKNLDKNFIELSLCNKIKINRLKNWKATIRKKILKQYPITPFPYLITCSNNEKYKLIMSEKNYESQIQSIIYNTSLIKNFDFVPKIILKKNNFIIVKYYEGEFPNYENENFAKKLGKIIASIHNSKNLVIDKSELINEVSKNKTTFERSDINFNSIISKIEKDIPKQYPGYLTYGDHNVSNYVLHKNELILIDMGSYVFSKFIDHHLINSEMFKKIDKEIFFDFYNKTIKENYLFSNIEKIKFIGSILFFINAYQRYHLSPIYDLRYRKHKYLGLIDAIKKLKEII